jgi:hypothetical protein
VQIASNYSHGILLYGNSVGLFAIQLSSSITSDLEAFKWLSGIIGWL